MAGLVPRSFINDIIAKADIVDVVGSRVKLKKAGSNNYQACCPFHHEKTPSFTVSKNKQFYHCFGCGAHGNALSFLMEYDKLEFLEAVEELANMLGLDVPREQSSKKFDKPQLNYQAKRDLYELMGAIAEFYQQQLPKYDIAQQYLTHRGLSPEIIQRFGIGFVPDSFNSVLNKFGQMRSEQDRLFDLGMLSRNDNGKVYDRFRNRVMFPIRDRRGRVIAFGGRVLGDEKPKYLNSPESVTYHKGNELYGLFEALQINESPDQLLIVEGYMDVVALAQYGVDYAVASLGTATTPEQIQQAFRLTDQIVCCYDGDRAGREAAWRALQNALPYLEDGRQLKFIFLPDGEDPDTFVRQYGKQGFEQYLEGAQSLTDFLFFHLFEQNIDLSSNEGKSKLAALAVPLIKQIPGQMLRLYLRNSLAQKLGIIDERQLESLIPTGGQKKPTNSPQPVKQTPMRMLIALLLHKPSLALLDYDVSALESLNIAGLDLFENLTALCRDNVDIKLGQILEYWRGTEYEKPLETLATWDHLIESDNIDEIFMDNLAFLFKQITERRIEQLIAKDRSTGLEPVEKQELVQLLAAR